MSNNAPVKWAQRSDLIFLTICLLDVEVIEIKLHPNRLIFTGKSDAKLYSVDLELYREIDTQISTWTVQPSSIQFKLGKKAKRQAFWPRLLLDKNREKTNVSVDWDKYVDEEDEEVEFGDEVQNIDAIIAEEEEENIMTEELIANVEYNSLFKNESFQELTQAFDSIDVDADLIINDTNFVPSDPSIRPPNWTNYLTKRLILREYVELLEGSSGSEIKDKELREDLIMVQEIQTYGRLLNISALRVRGNIERAAIHVTADNFDHNDSQRRPPAWTAIRLRRVVAQEDLTVDDGSYQTRPQRVEKEEHMMIDEVLKYGQVVSLGAPEENPARMSEVKALAEDDSGRVSMIRNRSSTRISTNMGLISGGGGTRVSSIRMTLTEKDIETLSPEQRERRDALMKRVLTKEQADRAVGIDEETIASTRKLREIEESRLMDEEAAKHGKWLDSEPEVQPGRKRAATLQQDVVLLEINKNNFEASNPLKRPDFWQDIRDKRVMLKEHIDRMAGISEPTILDQRLDREIEEEVTMVGEVMCYGRLLGVGESGRNVATVCPVLVINSNTFDEHDGSKRPPGWLTIRNQRILLKELEDRLNQISETDIREKRDDREIEEDALMVREAVTTGTVNPTGTRVSTVSLNNKTNTNENQTGISSVPESPRPEIEVTAKDLDMSDTEKKPKGWAEIKLRKVYMKEWKDRRDGADESDIISKRFYREREAEEEMNQAITVYGKIKLFENRIQARKAAPLFPGSFKSTSSKIKV